MKTTKPPLTVIIMFFGMLLGLIIVMTLPNKNTAKHAVQGIEIPKPEVSLQKGKSSILRLIQVIKLKRRMDQLMLKDSLGAADSMEISTIDQHLNQLLHD